MQKVRAMSIIPAVLLFLALLSWPYEYYQFLRWVVCIFSLWVGWELKEIKLIGPAIVFGAIAITFNPISPLHMLKETWQLIDIGAGLAFVAVAMYNFEEKSRSSDTTGA